MQIMHPMSAENEPQIKSRNTMILQSHSLDQDKAFEKFLKFKTLKSLKIVYLDCLTWYALHVIFGYF